MAQKIVSPRAELTVLRAICHKDRKIAGAVLGSVDESYFDSEESIELLKVMKHHVAESGEIPSYKLILEDPSVSQEARSFFRDSDATVQTTEEAHKAVKTLNRYRQLRTLYQTAAYVDAQMQKGKVDLDGMLEHVSNQVAAARTSKTTKDSFLHFGKNNNSQEFIKDLLYNDSKEDTIPTGIKIFDSESGGFMRGSLVSLGASSGGGKSLMGSTQLAMNIASFGYKVVVVPLEMSKIEMASRFMANLAGLDVTKILQRRLAKGERELVEEKYTKWVKRVKKNGGRLTVFKPTEDLDIEEVFAAVNSYGPDVVLIDYISLLKGADGDDAWQKLGAMARLAKINAEATNRVNILLCQVSDEGKIRYARAISEHSTNSWIWVAKKEERSKDVGRITVEQPKSRNSRSFSFDVGIEWAHMRVVDVDQSDDVGNVATPMKNLAADV
jgi:hypothetical protein